MRKGWGPILMGLVLVQSAWAQSIEAPVNPFGDRSSDRDDARPGQVELSDGTVVEGQVYLTRDARLRVFDNRQRRFREVPWSAIDSIEGAVQREWREREWRFKENANDEKVYTGRSYPARMYLHTLTLRDGSQIEGPLSAVIYVRVPGEGEARKFLLHKRDKGAIDTKLSDLIYVRRVQLTDSSAAGATGEDGDGRAAGNAEEETIAPRN